MAESLEQVSRRRGSGRLRSVAVVERGDHDVFDAAVAAHLANHDLAGEAAPRWSFRRPETEAAPSALPAGDFQPTAGEPRRASFGPAGKARTPAGVVALSVLTLGLYSVVWHQRVNCEMGDFDPRLRVRPGRSTWAVFIPWMLGISASLAGAAILVAQHVRAERVAFAPDWLGLALLAGVLAVPYLTLLLPFGGIAVAMTLERVRLLQEHTGVPGDVQVQPVREVARLLIPVTGSLSLLMHQQSALDDVWDWADTAPNRRRRRV